jgi:hypothetical protein
MDHYRGRTYKLGEMDVPVMVVNEATRQVCLRIGTSTVWVKASDLEGPRLYVSWASPYAEHGANKERQRQALQS